MVRLVHTEGLTQEQQGILTLTGAGTADIQRMIIGRRLRQEEKA